MVRGEHVPGVRTTDEHWYLYNKAFIGPVPLVCINSRDAIKPFHVVAGVRAPHNPMTPAPWYEDALPGLRAPRSPAYNLSATVRFVDMHQDTDERCSSTVPG